jgi:hypothetical protein
MERPTRPSPRTRFGSRGRSVSVTDALHPGQIGRVRLSEPANNEGLLNLDTVGPGRKPPAHASRASTSSTVSTVIPRDLQGDFVTFATTQRTGLPSISTVTCSSFQGVFKRRSSVSSIRCPHFRVRRTLYGIYSFPIDYRELDA